VESARTTEPFAGEFQPRDRVPCFGQQWSRLAVLPREHLHGLRLSLASVYTNLATARTITYGVRDMTGDGCPKYGSSIRRFRNRSLPDLGVGLHIGHQRLSRDATLRSSLRT